MMLPAWKLRARRLYWQGKTVGQIAVALWVTQEQVRQALFARVP